MSEPLSVFDAARDAPHAPALVDGAVALTFAALAERVRARIDALPCEPDPRKPHPVTGEATLDAAVTLYALLERRVPALLLHPRLTAPERDALLAAAARSGPLPVPDAAAIVHTSGTTGVPRAAVLSRAALVASARASEANLGWQEGDRWLLCMPLAHVGGLSILTRCLAARTCAVLRPKFDPVALPEWIERDRVTLASLVPTMLARALDAHRAWRPPPHLRAILVGGAGAPPALLARAEALRIPLVMSYGLTESCAQIVATRYASRFAPAREHSGFPLPGVELRIGEGAHVLVRGATMMSGYWNEAPLPRDAWFDTGDVGEIDASGALVVRARRVDLIVTGGENVYPAEVEAALEACPGVAVAGVFGVPDETWGETVAVALVASGSPPDASALRAWMRERLAPHKRPRAFAFVDALPHTSGGKLDRRALAQFAGALRAI